METKPDYSVFNLMFNTSFELTQALKAGIDAQQFCYPAKVENQDFSLFVTFVRFDAESQKNMNMSDNELIDYVKSTFLGTAKPAEKIAERIIMGQKSSGQLLKSKIPTPSNIEIHLITLQDSTKFAISFKSNNSVSSEDFEKIIIETTSSLKMRIKG